MGGVEKISSEHRARLACIYVRQSTPAQTRNNTESLELQYELSERAVALGWPAERIEVIDSDLGISAAGDATADREGFKELVAEVARSGGQRRARGRRHRVRATRQGRVRRPWRAARRPGGSARGRWGRAARRR
jgi:hypothetical protein